MKRFLQTGAAAVILLPFFHAPFLKAAKPRSEPPVACTSGAPAGPGIIVTDRGAVRVRIAGGSLIALGIPYAAPPVGRLRFRPPQSHDCWAAVLDALAYGNVCPQIPPGGSYTGNEDCLNLNVWSPSAGKPGEFLPVQVFFHGGGGTYGSSRMTIYGSQVFDAQAAAETGRSVMVTVNVRLGFLGYMALPELDAESPHHVSGNYAILDMIAALRWVQSNIAAFHGDPKRVTLRGMSSGAINSAVVLTSPLSAGLFSRVVLESGMYVNRPTLARIERDSRAALPRLHCDSAPDVTMCLRALPAEALVAAYRAEPLYPGGYRFGPNVDGYVFPKQFSEAFAEPGGHHHVPVILGTNADEGTTLFSSLVNGVNTPEDYAERVRALYGDRYAAAISAHYPVTNFESPFYAMAAVITDSLMTCPARTALRNLARSQSEGVWRYFYTPAWSTGSQVAARAGHQTQLGFTFHNLNQSGFAPTPSERSLSDAFVGYFGRFAAHGNPNGSRLLRWPQSRSGTDDYLQFDDAIRAGKGVRAGLCDFWDTVALPAVGPDAVKF